MYFYMQLLSLGAQDGAALTSIPRSQVARQGTQDLPFEFHQKKHEKARYEWCPISIVVGEGF